MGLKNKLMEKTLTSYKYYDLLIFAVSGSRFLSPSDNLNILAELDKGRTEQDIAVQFGVPPDYVLRISQNRETIVKEAGKLASCGKRFKSCE